MNPHRLEDHVTIRACALTLLACTTMADLECAGEPGRLFSTQILGDLIPQSVRVSVWDSLDAVMPSGWANLLSCWTRIVVELLFRFANVGLVLPFGLIPYRLVVLAGSDSIER